MAFWGIEIEPGKPYILSNEERGRLHVTQATLGSGKPSPKSILQCKVGDKKPVYLCSLLPNKLETCALNLEFEEDEEVAFSIIGSQSVHLTGFFYGDESDDDSEGDGYGCGMYDDNAMGIDSEDVDDSIDYDSEDEEEDVDCSKDDGCCGYAHSPVRKSGVKIEEIIDDEKPADENGSSKRGKKNKSQSSMSKGNENSNNQIVPKARTSVPILESEDEDGFPVPARDKSEKPDAASGRNLKRKSGAVNKDEEPPREIEPHCSDQQHSTEKEVTQKKNKKKKVVQKLDSSLENGKSDSVGIKESPIAKAGNDLMPSSEKKKEKKRNKLQENAAILSAEKKVGDKNEADLEKKEQGGAAKPLQVRTFPNGLIIEELAMGKPDGMRASPGKKVSVRYIGKLKKNNKTFDSNIGKAPFKFRLGIGQVIKGWDVGVNGMRVGDKRRLTIPPEMGYGAQGSKPVIPPNAWLLFDVELVNVN